MSFHPYLKTGACPGRRTFLGGLAALCAAALISPKEAAGLSYYGNEIVPEKYPPAYESRVLRAKVAMVKEIRRCLGHPYIWGAEGPDAFDCSGLILWLYGRIGIRLPRVAVEQGSVGIRVPDHLIFGDVLLFKRQGPGWHIGLYLARGQFVHAAGRKSGVIISSLRDSRFRSMFRDARRYIDG